MNQPNQCASPRLSSTLSLFAVMVGAGMSLSVGAACDFVLNVDDSMVFPLSEMRASAQCASIEVSLRHGGRLPEESMGRNWVLARAEDVLGIAVDGMAAGPDLDYLQPDDPRVLAATAMIGSGEQTRVRFSPRDLEPGTDYRFFCSFPGHWAVMTGRFVIDP